MTNNKFLFTISNGKILHKLIKDMKVSAEEQRILNQCILARVDVIPAKKHLKIFLELEKVSDENLIIKVAFYIKEKYNPDGEVTVSPKRHLEGSLFDNIDYDMRNKNWASVSTNDEKIIKKFKSNMIDEEHTTIKPNFKVVKGGNEVTEPIETPDELDDEIPQMLETSHFTPEPKQSDKSDDKQSVSKEPVALPEVEVVNPKIEGKTIKIDKINKENQRVIIEGIVLTESDDIRLIETSKGMIILRFSVIDRTNGINCTKFYNSTEKNLSTAQIQKLRENPRVRVKGSSYRDNYSNEMNIRVDKIELLDETELEQRKDESAEKRVELHCHTRMSPMDAIMGADEVINQAAKWNWKAVAITDHGVVQAYPEAAIAAAKLKKKGVNIKVIYGVEGYLVGDNYQQSHANHVIILAKNTLGLKNLYTLVSLSHMKFFYRTARIPKSMLAKYREGLIIGSACEAGELIRAIVGGKSEAEIEEIARFYDYLEIQPIHNNDFLKRSEDFPHIKTDKDLISINLKVAKLAEKLNKPLVATCDSHFINSEDSIYRAILMRGKGFKDAEKQPPLYLRTTDEMLKEFYYLDEKLAYEAVITNPNKIAEEIDELTPIPDSLYSPMVDNAESELRTQAYGRATELYGEDLPQVVKKRLEQELKPITEHGYSALYMIAERLVKKSNSDGYIVGSRGSVGSSFVATMLGITEVNPLPPHWYCPNCKNSKFITDGSVNCGYDLEDKDCPKCGTKMLKDGHDIPFAVFLGFDGDKVPDIDLNFSGEYQPQAHKYTEVLFGKYNVYRAGTISTVAAKTAYGFVKSYYEEVGQHKNGAFISYIARRCQGVKRTTGQHPAGIMVVPRDMDVHYFTPLQRPADDKESQTITTHFDYHSISERLVKLDILGHDDPTTLKMLEDLTGVKALDVPLDDSETMSLFTSTKALNINADELGSKTGTFGIPEFRTAFTRQMIDLTHPHCFSDLVRISGFSHGTDVWLGNAQELIQKGTCTLKDAISARDDIMTYLIYKGVDPLLSFKTMEGVRKGRGISIDVVEELKKHNVPDWYIESCQKIKYLFPKAHATAYVIMAFRIAWFKVHYPLAYYAAYFTSRGEEFDADEVIQGDEYISGIIKELESKPSLDVKETAKLSLLQVAHEMFLRGIKIMRVNLYESDDSKFIIRDQCLLPSLRTLHGLGEVAAKNIVEMRQQGEFTSVEDLKNRAKLNKTNVEVLRNHGCLDNMTESNQQTLFM